MGIMESLSLLAIVGLTLFDERHYSSACAYLNVVAVPVTSQVELWLYRNVERTSREPALSLDGVERGTG